MSPPNFPITPAQLRGRWQFGGLEPGVVQLGSLTLLAHEAGILMHDSFWYAEDFRPAWTFGHAAAEYAVGLTAAAGARCRLD